MTARSASVAAIAAGAAVFVVASLVTPLAGADTATRRPGHHPRQHQQRVALDGLLPSASTTAPGTSLTPRKTLSPKTLKATKTARVDHGFISGLASNGIPKVALNAYRVAAARMANVEPSCGVDWAMLAGIGREESDHGRFGGAVLHSDGVSTPAIIGPALDGKIGDYIPAPPNGLALDGDAKYAHALGPMQFIPSTWDIYGTDGDGDGKANIFDINDAALATARYLCAAGGNLRTHAGRVAGVLAYNHSDEYLAQVLALAQAYRTGVSITGVPVGITTGKLPKIGHPGYVPPANPGAPTAAQTAKQKAAAAARKKAAQQKARQRNKTGQKGLGGTTTPPPSKARSTTSGPQPTPGRSGTKPTSTAPTSPTPTATSTTPPTAPSTCTLLGIPTPCMT